jgi:hypothetical protein
MSRSKRHTPITGVAPAPSEKEFKQKSTRTLRLKQKQAMRDDPDAAVLPLRSRDVLETWSGPKDGKSRFDPQMPPRRLRK